MGILGGKRYYTVPKRGDNAGERRCTVPFPTDDYTPYGYLDTPTHTRNLTPRGVLRSHGAGFRWHFPAHAGMYGGLRETYRAGFRLVLEGATEIGDFDRARSPYHSKNLFTFDVAKGSSQAQITFQLVGEHVLHAEMMADGRPSTSASEETPGPPAAYRRWAVVVEYTRLLSASGQWGESGLVGRIEDGLLVLQGFEDGEAFMVWTSRPWADAGITADATQAAAWSVAGAPGLPQEGFFAATGRRGATVSLHAVLGWDLTAENAEGAEREKNVRQSSARSVPSAVTALQVMMARGRTADDARRHLAQARREAEAERARKLAEDTEFWAAAPRLGSEWPGHWRRGMVYDVETVRMVVRRPTGTYRHVWDAMQIQAPRVVLAEAAMDALLLGYADPALAQELLLSTFLDAPAPNVPCSREDGSYNMVAADGTVCGTAPEWGYPLLVTEWLYALRPDEAWLARLYPRLADYLDWWLTNRRDPDGWLVYACSWESGQDDSPRFGDQPLGGGHPVRHVRPADLQAAVAHACRAMERLAGALGKAFDVPKWRALADEFAGRTDALWLEGATPDARGPEATPRGEAGGGLWSVIGGRYADYDTRAAALTGVDDVMLLAPAALRVATAERLTALVPALQAIDPQQLTWPMLAWTAVEAALAADRFDQAAELAAAVCERAYGFWDVRPARADRTLPGISCEYWPVDGRCGGEGYGWGAFTTHLLLRGLLGFEPDPGALHLRPNLPPAWRVPGRRYAAEISWRGRRLRIELEPLDGRRAAVTVDGRRAECGWGERLAVA